METTNTELRVALMGVGSGLGREVLIQCLQSENTKVAAWSRHKPSLEVSATQSFTFHEADFTNEDVWPTILGEILEFKPHRLLYIAGGGPYGLFSQKKWTAHLWALRLNFLFPTYLAHTVLSTYRNTPDSTPQLTFVGSAIAESALDPGASSYSAAKHGLRGLVLNLANENKELDIRLYSPGYMDTLMLPKKSAPREGGLAEDPKAIAKDLLEWLKQPIQVGEQCHRIIGHRLNP